MERSAEVRQSGVARTRPTQLPRTRQPQPAAVPRAVPRAELRAVQPARIGPAGNGGLPPGRRYAGRMEKHAWVRWSGGLDFEAGGEAGARAPLAGDEDAEGFRPAALLLAALAGCSAMDTISILLKKRQEVAAYSVDVRGQQRDEHPRTFREIVVEHLVNGEALDDAAVARAIELSATRYCVVSAHLSIGDTVIHHRYRIRDANGERSAEVVVTGPLGAGLTLPLPA
jgi:putative redox protein